MNNKTIIHFASIYNGKEFCGILINKSVGELKQIIKTTTYTHVQFYCGKMQLKCSRNNKYEYIIENGKISCKKCVVYK